jgi:hypothetical protein
MACYHPIPAYHKTRGGPVTLGPPLGSENLALPCGKCVGCRTDRATMWARRCTHEAKLWDSNIFVTLTYDDEHLPEESHLAPKDLQLFFKRLRKNTHGSSSLNNSPKRTTKRGKIRKQQPDYPIRYFACGEYGETNGRPHYHAAIFNLRLNDKKQAGTELYESELLTTWWKKGQAKFSEFTPATAAYIAQYQLKKQRGDNIDQNGHYRPEPFLRTSQGIGRDWLDKYAKDLQHGYIIDNAKKGPIPRYYKQRIKTRRPDVAAVMEAMTEKHLAETATDKNRPERLQAQEIIHTQQKNKKEKRDLKTT